MPLNARGLVGVTATLELSTIGFEIHLITMAWSGANVVDIDVTNETSTGGDFSGSEQGHDYEGVITRQFAPGSMDWGSISATGSFDPEDELPLDGAFYTDIKLKFPNGGTTAAEMVFDGFVTGMTVNGLGVDEHATIDLTVRIASCPNDLTDQVNPA